MSEKDPKNLILKFLLPNIPVHNPLQNHKQEGSIKFSKNISGGSHVEERYRMLEKAAEQSIDGIAVADMNGIIQFCNQAWAKMHGYQIYELLGKHLSIFHTKEQMEEDVIPFNEQVKKKGAYHGEVGHLKRGGKTFLTRMSTTILKDEKGKPFGLLGIARDITKQRRVQEMLAVSERKYRKLFEDSIEGIGISKGNRIVAANKTLLNIFGYESEKEFCKVPLLYLVDMESRDKIKERMKKRQKGEYVEPRFEYRIIRKDGAIRDVEASSSEILIGNEKCVLTTFCDITEIKKTTQRISKINDCFINFGTDPGKNINSLVSLCGEVMRATCALYSRLDKDTLYSTALWQVPPDFNPLNNAEGLICYDVIKRGGEDFFIVRDLDRTSYAQTDPYVLKYNLKTYIGLPINFENNTIGSLCVVYQNDFTPSQDDKRFMQIIASAIAIEEKRRFTQEEAHSEGEKYKTLTENIKVGIFRLTGEDITKGKFIEVNSSMVEMFGFANKEEFLYAKSSDLYVDGSAVEQIIRKIFKGGYVKEEEVLLKRKDGTIFTASVSVSGVRDETGRIQYLDGIIEDITQRKKAEGELLNISKFPSQNPHPVLRLDSKGNVIYKNEAVGILLKNSNFSDKDILNILPDNILVTVEKTLRTNEVLYGQESRIGDKTYSYAIVPMKDAGYVNLYGVDITERKKAEEVLQRREYFLNNVFESIRDGISVSDKEMRIIRVNKAMEEWYEYAMPLVGKKCYEAYHGRDKLCDVCPTIKTLQTGKPAYEVVPWRDKERKIIGWFDLYSFPLMDTQTNKINGVIEYVRDITQRKLAEERSEKLNKELFKSNRRLKTLVVRDPHTGLYNYRYLQGAIEAEFCRTERYSQPLSMIMLDLDYFKSINDAYGHQFGDLVLKQFGRQLKRMVRKYDSVIRFGGEEFVIICPGIDKQTTSILAQRILDKINLTNFGNEEQSVKLKSSLAVVSYPEDPVVKSMDLIEFADRILNKAKEDGGDRVYSSLDIKQRNAVLEKASQKTNVRFLKVKIDRLHKRASQSLIESVFAFARTIKLKDHYTGEHVEHTVHYATEIAKELNLAKDDIEHVRRASMLHDLGKIGISESTLLKKGKLTKREFRDIKKHPQIGVDILRPIHFLRDIIPLIHYHHERWDGKGYPYGLKNEEIPLGARIIAIADVFQALTSDRPYRKAYPKDKAIEIIQAGSGTQFDPKIVDTFFKIL